MKILTCPRCNQRLDWYFMMEVRADCFNENGFWEPKITEYFGGEIGTDVLFCEQCSFERTMHPKEFAKDYPDNIKEAEEFPELMKEVEG